MNKKFSSSIYLFLISFMTIIHLYIPIIEASTNNDKIIPNEAIRLRILANSNSDKDQAIKEEVRDAVNEQITDWLGQLNSLADARQLLIAKQDEIEEIARRVIEEADIDQTVSASFNKVRFPTKQYGQFLYPAGEYEAVVITLGAGKGLNWWCVLFPPLCFVDFSAGQVSSDGFTSSNEEHSKKLTEEEREQQAKHEEESRLYESEDEQTVEVKFFVKELWDKIFTAK